MPLNDSHRSQSSDCERWLLCGVNASSGQVGRLLLVAGALGASEHFGQVSAVKLLGCFLGQLGDSVVDRIRLQQGVVGRAEGAERSE